MISEPRESAAPGLAELATALPLWSSVIESPGVAPVIHASSTEPLPRNFPPTEAPASGALAVRAVLAERKTNKSPTPHFASARQLHMVPPSTTNVRPGRRCRSAVPIDHAIEGPRDAAWLGGSSRVLHMCPWVPTPP